MTDERELVVSGMLMDAVSSLLAGMESAAEFVGSAKYEDEHCARIAEEMRWLTATSQAAVASLQAIQAKDVSRVLQCIDRLKSVTSRMKLHIAFGSSLGMMPLVEAGYVRRDQSVTLEQLLVSVGRLQDWVRESSGARLECLRNPPV